MKNKNKNKKNIPDVIDLTQLDKNTFGFMTHDEFFTIQEISYIADIDIKALEAVSYTHLTLPTKQPV